MIPTKKAAEMTIEELGAYIDQSVLKPEFTLDQIRKYIQKGVDYKCKTVCVYPSSINIAKELTAETQTGICVVCDFPFGTSATSSKILQAEECCKQGIDELDIVANCGWTRSNLWHSVEADIKAVVDVCHDYDILVNAIFETDALTLDQIKKSTEVAISAGVDFIKTSTNFLTGFASKGATPETIKIIMDTAKDRCKIKASGAIKTREHFLKLIDMGIDRIGIGYKSTPVVLGLS
ncbi:deoxyribose-phosphate aldolase [Clostridium beijerinckii]|uniref:deoxyribose-phosphate aldolase n=1 Tax=Clostridium beijerinckii TaxID=1520 RepID=UPI0023308809|nr:deoxyribose-phosphate aldolase [Clostridium beijerinckii]